MTKTRPWLFVTFLLVACGGGSKPATGPEPSASASATAPAASSAAPAASASAAPTGEDDETSAQTKAAVAAAAPGVTPSGASTPLEALLKGPARAADFPKATAKDLDCNSGMKFTGTSGADYDALTGKCGAPTGLKEYSKKVTGKFDATHLGDRFSFHMTGGFCYRFFAVADKTVQNVTIRIQRPSGDLVSIASSRNFISIMDPDTTWCKTHDRDFDVIVETSAGSGAYTFGIWARPK